MRRGFTLVEIMVAVGLFAFIGTLSLNIFMNVTRIQARLNLENNIYEDARFMMERISRSIRNNAVDYEEYFNKSTNSAHQYGEFYGCYAAQFYNPGIGKSYPPGATDIITEPGGLGALCNDGKPYTGQECVVFKPSIDLNTGKYPYLGALPVPAPDSNAFCPIYKFGAAGCTIKNQNKKDELYLINKEGTRKTVFARKRVSGSPEKWGVAMIEKIGDDTNKDGLTETWLNCVTRGTFCCNTEDYDCGGLATLESSLLNDDPYKGFVAISPQRTTVTRLVFNVSPGEDPHKAFAEQGSVEQPKVTITLEARPSKDQLILFGGLDESEIPKITLQTTISTRIQSEVKSYRGVDTYTMGTPPVDICKLSG